MHHLRHCLVIITLPFLSSYSSFLLYKSTLADNALTYFVIWVQVTVLSVHHRVCKFRVSDSWTIYVL
ncbi:Bet1-like SNARE 1-1 [Zea mays]|uniref:Bet1-like SNARE 1-1 n=1 Tax=Zea mays TaxID=4577 RepID=A0A1D6HPU0_MAIZE|nr:Bet1-like SNARE 1-1 [Zea mays]